MADGVSFAACMGASNGPAYALPATRDLGHGAEGFALRSNPGGHP